MKTIKKILVANRGEIALRIMKAAKKMGISTIAVFSEADRNTPYVKYADAAICIGEPPAANSYLLFDKIIGAAKELGADAIHPGYGFLSENPYFAENVEKENIIFIGPKSNTIKIMGSKLAAKEAVKEYGIPLVPGTDKAITDIEQAKVIARDIGYPILIKASAGGGGKGMRVVEKEADFENQMRRAVSESTAAFGDGSVFIEKYVASPRHIEIQILADEHGNVIHVFERECSIQRRHQKVVEEAPSVVLTPEKRQRMGAAAIQVAKACNYVGAGTVEFLFDENQDFYFLEMNTRLQVEYPVTEMISGVNIIEQQIKIARGEELEIKQDDLKINGHAIELRVYAEDPSEDFLPGTGILTTYKTPSGNGIRVDDGFEEGMEIPIYYDPMIAKLIAHGKDRNEAIQRMIKAIDNYHVDGIKTTLPFGTFVMKNEAFVSGNFDTHFVSKHFTPEIRKANSEQLAKIAAYVALNHYKNQKETLKLPKV